MLAKVQLQRPSELIVDYSLPGSKKKTTPQNHHTKPTPPGKKTQTTKPPNLQTLKKPNLHLQSHKTEDKVQHFTGGISVENSMGLFSY